MSDESIEEQEIGSEHQRKLFDRYMKLEGAEEGLKALRDVSVAAGLNPSELGVKWGLSVFVDKDTFVRLNVADYSLFDVRQPKKPLLKRKSTLAYLPQTRTTNSRLLLSGMTYSRSFRKLPQGESLKNSTMCWFPFGKLEQLLAQSVFVAGVKAHVDARPREIFKTRHNPFVGEAIFG